VRPCGFRADADGIGLHPITGDSGHELVTRSAGRRRVEAVVLRGAKQRPVEFARFGIVRSRSDADPEQDAAACIEEVNG
jgi:hypothetical protein